MKLHRYLKPDGTFDYGRYVRVQTEGNKRKLHSRWVHRGTVDFLAAWLKQNIAPLSFGICHGTRRGDEQAWFRERLGCEVIGTEISETATQFPHTIQWDFHDAKAEWLEKADFIYSNSYDHSFDPALCFRVWAASLRVGGVMLLEHNTQNTPAAVNELDPFGIERDELVAFLDMIGGEDFGVREVIAELPYAPAKHLEQLAFIVVEKRRRMDGA
jgi:hypothetical protein